MKHLLIVLGTIACFLSLAQNGLHFQFHNGEPLSGYRYNHDTLIVPLKMSNVSNYNAVAIVNINSEQWSTITYSTPLTFSNQIVTNLVMKDLNEGLCVTSGSIVSHATNDFWKTTNPVSATISALAATKYGYYGYKNIPGCGASCTYTYVFSNNGTNWNNTLIQTNASIPPVFYKSKDKIYTLHNKLLKVSADGGANYLPVNNTYTFNASFPVNPAILTLNNDTILVQANQLHRSYDGGATWSIIAMPTTSNAVGQITAKNAREIMIIDKFTPYNIYYSGNAGTSWVTYTNLPFYTPSGATLFANEQSFFLNLSPFYKSTNGSSWQNILSPAPAPGPYDISFTSNVGLVGFAQGYVGYTTNRGYNYNFLPNKIPGNFDAMAVKAININKFLVADRKSQIFLSTDQGVTWSQKTTNTINNIPRKFCVSNDQNTIVLAGIGVTYVSFDAAATFTLLNISAGGGHYQTIKPNSGKIIDVVPVYTAPSFTQTAYEFYEINGSNSRTLLSTYSVTQAQDIVDIQMRDDNVGYFMTRNPQNNETIVYKTTNGFITTTTISTIPTPSTGIRTYDGKYGNIQTFGNDTVMISGSGNPTSNQTNFYHISINGGLTWNIVYTNFNKPINPLGNNVYKMVFFNPGEYMALISGNLCGSAAPGNGVFISASAAQGLSTGINDLFFDEKQMSDFFIYPNPSSDEISLQHTSGFKEASLSIYDIFGKKVMSSSNINGFSLNVKIDDLVNGLYLIELKQEGRTISKKFIKN